MAKIIAVANQKGGVGKTTTTVNLSACIAQQGKRVLCVDIDPQGNSTSGLGIDKEAVQYSVYDVLINGVDPKEGKGIFVFRYAYAVKSNHSREQDDVENPR